VLVEGDAESLGDAESVGDTESVGEAESVGETESVGVASATYAAGSAFCSAAVATPGSTRLTSRPFGRAELVEPSLWTTWTCTPSEGPTHSGSEAPRASAPASGSSSGSTFASRSFQAVHSPVSMLWVRTCAVPCSRLPASFQETPSIENCLVSVRGSSRLPLAVPFSARS